MKITFKKQLGLSLVELMVALTLSLVVMLVTTSIYVSNKNTYRFLDQYSLLQENGRFAMHYLRENILRTGFPNEANINPFPVVPTENTYANGSDDITVSFRSATDCLGNAPAGAAGLQLATKTFDIAVNGQGVSELRCDGSGLVGGAATGAAVLVEGIQNMQIEYGVDTDIGQDGIANTYVTAAQVQAGVMPGGNPDWDRVVSVRVAVLVQGEENTLDAPLSVDYNILGQRANFNDRIPRRVFTTTIPLRNRDATIGAL